MLSDEQQTLALGAKLASKISSGTVFLSGDLGAGKTCLTRGWLQALGHMGAVKSPTYTLVEPYHLGERQIYHFDLYRLDDAEELEFIGARDYFDRNVLCLVEWPERGMGFLPAPKLDIRLRVCGRKRQAELTWATDSGVNYAN